MGRTIGDALIYMTKALVLIAVLICGTVVLIGWHASRVWEAESALAQAQADVLNLGDRLDECIKGAGFQPPATDTMIAPPPGQ